MNNIIWLKWGSLKAYNFTDEFIEKNKEVVEEFVNVWDKIYENHCSAFGGSEEVHKNKDFKMEIISVLEKLFNLGVIFENGWDDTYYNNFNEIRKYILNFE